MNPRRAPRHGKPPGRVENDGWTEAGAIVLRNGDRGASNAPGERTSGGWIATGAPGVSPGRLKDGPPAHPAPEDGSSAGGLGRANEDGGRADESKAPPPRAPGGATDGGATLGASEDGSPANPPPDDSPHLNNSGAPEGESPGRCAAVPAAAPFATSRASAASAARACFSDSSTALRAISRKSSSVK